MFMGWVCWGKESVGRGVLVRLGYGKIRELGFFWPGTGEGMGSLFHVGARVGRCGRRYPEVEFLGGRDVEWWKVGLEYSVELDC